MTREERRQHVLDVFSDMMSDVLYYDRKEDSSLQRGDIEAAIADGDVTVNELLDIVREALTGRDLRRSPLNCGRGHDGDVGRRGRA